MGRAMAGVLIVAIIAVAVLLLVRSMNRTAERKKNLSDTLVALNLHRAAIARLEYEMSLQISAGYFDPAPVQGILSDLKKDITTT